MVTEIRDDGPQAKRISISANIVTDDVVMGASIAINGCCLTVIEIVENVISFQAGSETLSRTNLGELVAGSRVNLERAMRAGDRFGGHIVSGHVDGLGKVDQRIDNQDWSDLWFQVSEDLLRQMAPKGSVTVDGISLTLVNVEAKRFSVALIPHTLAETTLGNRQSGDTVNIETDLLAKYVEKQLSSLRK